MRKNALIILLATLVLSVFGAFLRWLQTRNIFEAESGLAVRGAPISAIYVLFSAVVLACIVALVLLLLRRTAAATAPAEALRCESAVPKVLATVLAVVFLCAALLALFTAGGLRRPSPAWQRAFGATAIFGGLCFPFLLPKRSGDSDSASRTAGLICTVFYCFWLIFAYKLHAESPVIWAYGPEMLALAATTLGVYEVTAYFHGHAKPAWALIALYAAAFLDISVVFDVRDVAFTVMLAVSAALMLLFAYLLTANLTRRD